MDVLPTHRLTDSQDWEWRKTFQRRRMILALLVTLLIHLVVYQLLKTLQVSRPPSKTNSAGIVELKPRELSALKQQIQKSILLEQEHKDRYKTAQPAPDARYWGKQNQIVPQEQINTNPSQFSRGQKRANPTSPAQKLTATSSFLSKYGYQKDWLQQEARKLLPASQAPGQGDDRTPLSDPNRADARAKSGSETLLNTVESQYYSFFSRFTEPLIRNWYYLLSVRERPILNEIHGKNPSMGGEYICTLEFTINRKGDFTSVEIISPSGIPTLDGSTREALLKLKNLSHPPQKLFEGKDSFTYRMQFSLMISDRQTRFSQPNINWY